jgi:tetratricopeptide (TPR) repeat protein
MPTNPSSALAWIALVVGAAGVGLALRAGTTSSKEKEEDGMSDLLDARSMENRLNGAEGRLETAAQRIKDLEGRLTRAEAAADEAGRIARQASRLIEETARARSGPKGAGVISPTGTPAEEDADRKAAADAVLSQIREGKIPEGGVFNLFLKAKDLGILDQALAEMEKYAAAHADDPDAQVELAAAYIQKLMAVPEGMERGAWSQKSINSCEAALKINPEHWSAQFIKGMNLSQWPAFLGKQPEAIRTFEKLIEQQERTAPDPKFAQTYFQLGTTYRAAGNTEKARAVFARGLELYPENKQIKDQIEMLDKK